MENKRLYASKHYTIIEIKNLKRRFRKLYNEGALPSFKQNILREILVGYLNPVKFSEDIEYHFFSDPNKIWTNLFHDLYIKPFEDVPLDISHKDPFRRIVCHWRLKIEK